MKNLITCLVVILLSAPALAEVHHVPADFPTIQYAIDAASNGDEIIVAQGTYTSSASEVVNMRGKGIWLHSSKGEQVTIIDGEGVRRGIYCGNGETSKTIIEGFTITDGYADNGSGMYNFYSSPRLENCTFKNNTADNGGGMYNSFGNPTLENCTFESNTAEDGGGMYNIFFSTTTLTDCTFTSNTAEFGGGMHNDYSSPTLENCTFTGNTAQDGGGGIFNTSSSSSPTFENCTFTGNTAQDGGGMYNSSSSAMLENCTFTGNTTTTLGGGIYNNNSTNDITLINTTVCGNAHGQIYGEWTDDGGNTVEDVCPSDCPDINGDGYVNVSDLLTVIGQWGLTNSPADVNQDGIVDVSDLLMVVGSWGPCK